MQPEACGYPLEHTVQYGYKSLNLGQIKISPEHMKVLKNDLNSKDDRTFKEIVAFLIVFGEPLCES